MDDFFEKIKKVADPPQTDIFYVQDYLKEVLSYFKKHETVTSNIPLIIRQEQQINVQGIRFHACLQQSIAQSNRLETHAESVIDYIEILNDPVFDSSRILSVLKRLLENTRRNMEETQKIKDEYSDIGDKLIEINDSYCAQKIKDNERIQSLPKEKKKLSNMEGSRKNIITMITIFIIIGIILMFVNINIINSKYNTAGMVVTMILSSGPTLLYLRRIDSQIRNKIKELEDLESLKNTRSEIDTSQLSKKVYQPIRQIGAFNTYWTCQYQLLEDLNNNIENEEDNLKSNDTLPDQIRTILKSHSIRNRWEQVKTHCDNYTKTVRRLLVEV